MSACGIEEIRQARETIRPAVVRTPLVFSERLSEETGADIYLKLEGFQRTGAFKFRGAYNCVSRLGREALSAGLVTASSGNHALGMSLAARMHGVRAVVVMPHSAPAAKQERARTYGATVILHGSIYDEAYDHAQFLASKHGMTFVPSFDHPLIIAGQGTVGLEILEQEPGLDLIVTPVGGGGLLAGLLIAAAGVEVVGVQAEGAAAMARSLERGERHVLASAATVADGIATLKPGAITFDIASRYQARVVTVSDAQLLQAMTRLLATGVVAEPAAAAGVAALREVLPVAGRKVACVVTGGNVSGTFLAKAATGLPG
ncbi:MAG: threonine/serine dehydratase [Bacillota bacterium]